MLTGVENGWWGPEQPPGDVGAPNLITHELLGHGLTLQAHSDCDDPTLEGTVMACGSTGRGFQLGAPPLNSDQATTSAVDSPYTH